VTRGARWALGLGLPLYLLVAALTLPIDVERIAAGSDRARTLFAGFLSPNPGPRWGEIVEGIQESLAITVVATVIGVLLSVPLALGGARNLAPRPVYLCCRGVLAVTRAFHEVIVAIFLVAMFGFGPFAGVVTLAIGTIGFVGKLLAEEIEGADRGQLEAIQATGASWAQLILFAVRPQVLPRLLGLSLYRLDINFRESAVIGIVGAGGIGITLMTAVSRYEYDVAAAILLIIIGIVLAVEYSSAALRRSVL